MKLKFLFSILILTTLIFSYTISTFSDSTTSIVYNFTNAGVNDTYYVSVPLNINITEATLNVTGDEYWEGGVVTAITNNAGDQDYPVVAVDSNSNVHIFWQDDRVDGSYDIYYANSTFGPWTNQQLVTNAADHDEVTPDVAFDSNDVWHLTWLRDLNGGGSVVMYMNSSARTEVNVSEVGSSEISPAIAVAPNNSIHIAWSENVSGNYDIYYANSMDNFATKNQISSSSREDVTPDISIASNGSIVIIWQDPVENLEGTGKDRLLLAQACPIYSYVLYASSDDNYTVYTLVRGHVVTYFCNLKEPNVDFFSNDSAVFSFHEDGALARVKKAYVNDYDHWVASGYDETATVANFTGGGNIQLSVDLNDLVHVVFSNASGTYYSNSMSFSPPYTTRHILTSSVGNWQSIVTGSSGRAFIAWADASSGTQDIYFNFYGYVPTNPEIDLGTETAFSYVGEYNVEDNVTSISTALETYLPTCTNVTDSTCTVIMNTSSDTKGILNVEDISIVYGSQLTGAASGLSFKLSNDTDVSSNVIFSDADVYVYNNSKLISKIPISFSSQPDYTGWNSSYGITSNNLAYVITDPLSAATNAQNTSQKTIYLEWNNTGTSLVCLIDSSSVTPTTLDGITKGTHCSSNGGISLSPNTTTIGGVTYFVIPNVDNSGAVQIIREESTITGGGGGIITNPPSTPASNNPPIIANTRVTPNSGFVYNEFTYVAEVFDPDNDNIEFVRVYIDGVPHEMTSMDSSNSSEGREYTFSTYLGFSNNHEYYFTASDGKAIGSTIVQTGPIMYPVENVDVPVISSASGLSMILVIVIFLFAVVLFANKKFR